jgi:hypothetical protein
MLRIRRSDAEGNVVFSLSGRIQQGDLTELKQLLGSENHGSTIAFDLEEVRLVHREAVRFLARCEAQGISLKNCPAFVREWIERGTSNGYQS